MTDVQNQADDRGIEIQQTGVTSVRLPFFIADGDKIQQVLANIRFTVSLNRNIRGTHMSRLMEILTDYVSMPITMSGVKAILSAAIVKLNTNFAAIRIAFTFFVKKVAPISERVSMLDVDCEFAATLSRSSEMQFELSLAIPFTSLCPCSKEISDFGAHNQRSICRVKLKFRDTSKLDDFGIENFIGLIEQQGSSEVYPILKREDEKFVTETAYRNPKFVEDILRDIVVTLRGVDNLAEFDVECENFESIHNHNAFAGHHEIRN